MNDGHTELDNVLDDILERIQQGERPDIESLCAAHPEFTDDLRRLVPSLLIMEGVKPVSEPPTGTDTKTQMPQQLGEYRILRELGRGGMGIVYEAEQTSLGRRVALKMLPHLNSRNENAVVRFEREARAAARLHHTNIVPVFEVGRSEDAFYYTMQLIRGSSLDSVLEVLTNHDANFGTESSPARSADTANVKHREPHATADDLKSRIAASLLSGRFQPRNFTDSSTLNTTGSGSQDSLALSSTSGFAKAVRDETSDSSSLSQTGRRRHGYWNSVARIGFQAAGALAYSHAHGVVHRDIKPANLILDEDGVVWVTDFGLALTEDSNMTQTGDVLGTLRYLSPERFEGKCTERSDIYSLGVTLYELLVFRPAFAATDRLRLIESIRNSSPVPLRERDPGISRDLETIILKACDKDPASRYQTAAELREDLNRFLSDEPIKARRVSILEQTARWARRNRQLAGSLLAIAALLVLLSAGATMAFLSESRFLHEAEVANDLLERRLYAYEIQRADAAYQANNLDVVRKRLDACPQSLRDWEWNRIDWLARPRHVLSLRGYERPLFTPDGRYLVTAGLRGDADSNAAKVWDLSTGQTYGAAMSGQGQVTSLALTKDGRHLITGALNGIVAMWDMDSRKQLWSVPAHTDKIDGTACSPDGQRVATASWDQTLKILDAATGDVLVTVGPLGHRVRCAEFSPSGKQVATACYGDENSGTAKIWDASSGNLLFELNGHTGHARSVAFSPDGLKVITGGTDGSIILWSTVDGRQLETFRGHTGTVSALVFEPGGDQFVSGSNDRSIRMWDVETAQEIMRHRTGQPIAWLSYDREGRRLASFGGDSVRLWVPEGVKDVLLLRHGGYVKGCRFSPDGTQIASCSDDGTIRTWEVATGMLLQVLHGHEAEVLSVSWHPDGKLIASASLDQTVRLWEPESGRLIATVPEPGQRLNAVSFSPDGSRLAIGSIERNISILDVESRSLLGSLDSGEGIASLNWSPDGQFLASGYQGPREVVRIWDVQTGEVTQTLQGGRYGVAFTPDGSGLFAGSGDGIIRLFDLAGGGIRQQFDRHQGVVWTLAPSPNGRRLVSGSSEVKIWDAETGEELFSPRAHRMGVQSVSVSPDGKTIASSATDGTIAIWESDGTSVRWQTRNRISRASQIVDRLYHRHTFTVDVLAALVDDEEHDPKVRDLASKIATTRGDHAFLMFRESWSAVMSTDSDTAALELAWRKANAACSQVPDSAAFRTTLAVAEYRLGRYEAALRNLQQARESTMATVPVRYVHNVPPGQKAIHPVNIAYCAMALHQLDQPEQAKEELGRLRDLLQDSRWHHYLDATLALHQAQQCINPEK